MTIEEAIQHCKEVAKEKRYECAECTEVQDYRSAEECHDCAEEHKQLAEWLTELKQRREAEISEKPKSNDEHTAAYWMQKTMDAAHEAYDRLKDTVDFKNAIAEVEAIKQRMGITEQKKQTNADRIRQMTDEELCDFLDGFLCYEIDGYCRAEEVECRDCKMKWLKQEAKDDAESDTEEP